MSDGYFQLSNDAIKYSFTVPIKTALSTALYLLTVSIFVCLPGGRRRGFS